MSTEASYALQQSLYSLYRKYYHSGCVQLLSQKNFDNGTMRITKGGLYVLTEDIVFGPDPALLETVPEYASNNAYSMGFFAALCIETDGVVLDLQGHTIRQSYEHYARQRFFSIIELGNTPFVPGQGPGSVATPGGYTLTPATNCLILNGTLGLSSHGGIHGNNNQNIMLQRVTVQDFESTGIQLNGVDTAFIDCVTVKGIECAPLAQQAFTLFRHQIEIAKLESELVGAPSVDIVATPGGAACVSLERIDILTALDDLVALLIQPFIDADTAHTSDAVPKTVTAALKAICTCLQQLDDDSSSSCETTVSVDGTTTIRLDIQRFVQRSPDIDPSASPLPDGTAMYGMLFNSSGIAVGDLSAVCPANGGACCRKSASSDCCRPSKNVTVHNSSVSGLQLNARELVGVRLGDKIQRDVTGAVVNISVLDRTQTGSLLEQAQVYLNSESPTQTTWCLGIQRLLLCPESEYPISAFMSECADHAFLYNMDIMAHVSKGVFGIRAEDTHGLTIESTTLKQLQNLSSTTCPRTEFNLPTNANVVSLIKNPLDQTSSTAYGGADIRGVFVGKCEGVLLTKTTLDSLTTAQGICRGIDFDASHTGCVHALTASKLVGGVSTAVYVHHTCSKMTMRELINTDPKETAPAFKALLELIHAKCLDADENPSDQAKQDAKTRALCQLLRLPGADAQLVAFETPAKTGDLKLC